MTTEQNMQKLGRHNQARAALSEVEALDLLIKTILETDPQYLRASFRESTSKETKDEVEILEALVNNRSASTEELLRYERLVFENCEAYSEICLKSLAEVLETDPENPLAHRYIGTLLRGDKLYRQAYLFFDAGLRLKTADSNVHPKFHFNLADLGFEVLESGDRISSIGFPVATLNFQFSKEKGFFLPKFSYNCDNRDYEDVRLERGKDRTLCHIHNKLGKEQHTAESCPYLQYEAEQKNKLT